MSLAKEAPMFDLGPPVVLIGTTKGNGSVHFAPSAASEAFGSTP